MKVRVRPTPQHKRSHAQRGFSLLELMIASVIAVVISGMMFSVLTSQQRASIQEDGKSKMQENLRFAVGVMAKHIRMAGYGVGWRFVGGKLEGMPTLRTCTNCGGYDFDGTADTGVGSDQIMVSYRNPSMEFQLDRDYYQKNVVNCTTSVLQVGGVVATNPDQDDAIVVSGTASGNADVVSCYDESEPATRRGLSWTAVNALTMPRSSAIVGPLVVQPNAGAIFATACPSGNTIPARMTCGLVRNTQIGFYLRNETLWMDDNGDARLNLTKTAGTTPMLSQSAPDNSDDFPLATGIEDVQVAVCVPGYPNPSALSDVQRAVATRDCVTNPASAYWLKGAEFGATESMAQYAAAVRLTLVAKGPLDPNLRKTVSKRPSIEDHTVSDVPDSASRVSTTRYPRLVQSTIVQLPNLTSMQTFLFD